MDKIFVANTFGKNFKAKGRAKTMHKITWPNIQINLSDTHLASKGINGADMKETTACPARPKDPHRTPSL